MASRIAEGSKAPAFILPTADDQKVRLSSFKGQNVVVYFYPRDMTPGCTTEAVDFTALAPEFKKANTVVIGISGDSPERHAKFRDKHNLKVLLASDENGKTLEKYGVWKIKKLYGRTFMGIERTTFLIDTKGIVRRIWHKVRVREHAQAVLAATADL